MNKKTNNREVILDAAENVVMEMGAAHMSLDVVAKKAGVSKGGLMYHFPCKNALLKAMIQRLVEQFYKDCDRYEKELKDCPGRYLKSAILATLDSNEKRDRMGLSILAAVSQNTELLEPIRQAHQEHLKKLMLSGLRFEQAAIISLASDGLMFQELMRLSPFSAEQKKNIKNEMLKQIDLLGSGSK